MHQTVVSASGVGGVGVRGPGGVGMASVLLGIVEASSLGLGGGVGVAWELAAPSTTSGSG